MNIYLDSADINEIKQAHEWGFISGVTTNPSLMAKAGNASVIDTVKEIATLGFEHISVEPNCTDPNEFAKQAKAFAEIHPSIVIKVPVTGDGFGLIKHLNKLELRTNATLVFTPEQATLVGNSKADYCSVFFGRIEDEFSAKIKENLIAQLRKDPIVKRGLELIDAGLMHYETDGRIMEIGNEAKKELAIKKKDIMLMIAQICKASNIQSIAASIRSIDHFNLAYEYGYDIATVPFKVLMEILNNQQTADGVKQFLEAK